MEQHERITVWESSTPRPMRCEIEHLGEDCFEVRVLGGGRVVASEFVEGSDLALDRAEELKRVHAHPQR